MRESPIINLTGPLRLTFFSMTSICFNPVEVLLRKSRGHMVVISSLDKYDWSTILCLGFKVCLHDFQRNPVTFLNGAKATGLIS